jgi:membrane-associated PAP2 superfamily phosphatase
MNHKVNGYQFVFWHIIFPTVILVSVIVGLEYFDVDFRFSQFFYDFETQQWPLRNSLITKTVFHDWGQKLSIIMGVVIFLIFLTSLFLTKLNPYRKHLLFLFLASVSGPIFIAILKNSTHIYCPWSLEIFGGDKPYIKLFDVINGSLPVGHCFPGGHSGGGFAFLSLYFYWMVVKPEYKYRGLAMGLFIGFIFALTQEARGAHFISHDISSLLLCWLLMSFLFIAFYHKQLRWNEKPVLL